MATYISNGGAIPHATDHNDLLSILLNFLTGVVGTLPVNERWTTLDDDSVSVPGQRRVFLQGPGVPATGALTFSGQPANNETVVIDAKTYTFQTVLTNVDGNVLIGAAVNDSVNNLINAINLGAGSGVSYAAATTLHPTVSATIAGTNILLATAKTSGTSGNTIATSETVANASWASTTLGGALDGTTFVGIVRFDDIAADAQNWQLNGAIGYDPAEPYTNQPNISPACFLTLTDNVAMPFRIIANGRRFIVIAQTVLTFNTCYCGFYLPYATPSEFPFPSFIGGNTAIFNAASTTSNYTIGNFYDGPVGCAQLRHRDGTWLSYGSYTGSVSGSRPAGIPTNPIFPWDGNGGSEYLLVDSPGSNWPLFQAVLYSNDNDGNVYGELEGVYFVPSRNNFTNNIITIDSIDYVVIQNIYRSSEVNVAFRLT